MPVNPYTDMPVNPYTDIPVNPYTDMPVNQACNSITVGYRAKGQNKAKKDKFPK